MTSLTKCLIEMCVFCYCHVQWKLPVTDDPVSSLIQLLIVPFWFYEKNTTEKYMLHFVFYRSTWRFEFFGSEHGDQSINSSAERELHSLSVY